jgi:zinc-RING finger domain/B-box zinc finger
MDCPECKQEFDENFHIPMILTACGHTICELCLKNRYKKKNIVCPQCSVSTVAQNLNILPSNLALLQLKQEKVLKNNCAKHNKPIEAYCCNDKILTCITCLLEDGHKSHELASVPKAAKKQKELLKNYSASALQNKEFISKEIKDIKEKQNSVISTYNKLQQDFTMLFEVIRKILVEKEAQIQEKIKKTLDEEVSKISLKNQELEKFLENIENFRLELEISDKENDIDNIQKYSKRELMAKSATYKIEPYGKNNPFAQFSIGNEVNSFIKLMQSKFFQKTETTPTAQKKTKPTIIKEFQSKSKQTLKPSSKTITKPGSIEWENISCISKVNSDEDTLSMKSFDLNYIETFK